MPLKEPRHSCPMFDDAIMDLDAARSALDKAQAQIENGRSINESLRDWGTSWQEHAEEMEAQLAAETDDIDKCGQDLG